ncbi:MAG: hypothetical protein ACI9FR_001681 [Cryomorphaceae bacterium]|jgi:hypothetical protein
MTSNMLHRSAALIGRHFPWLLLIIKKGNVRELRLAKPYIYFSSGTTKQASALILSKGFACLAFFACALVSGCDNFAKKAEPVSPALVKQAPQHPEPSNLPLKQVSERDVRFAQTALNQLGYNLGEIDGFWGSRSETAMRAFEKTRKLASAGGALSELNLYTLSKATKVPKSDIESSIRQARSLAAKIDPKVPLSSSPQLIIVEQTYSVLAKANPYSEVLTTLHPGTGIYVIAIQDGWFKIESLSHQKGFIREN